MERRILMNVNELATKTTITITGEKVEVNASDPVKETIKKILQEKGIDSFTILVDGEEIVSTSDLPERFADHEIEVKRYVKAG
jgi:DNA-binding Lrp family transcriptional regulator